MTFNFKAELARGLKTLGLEMADAAYEPLEFYFYELKKWNKKVNLIAKSTGDVEIVEKHFLDSLTLLPFLQDEGAHLLDIGTGGGFPGLICKAALGESLKLTLVEPRLKRVSFLRHIVRSIRLDNVDIRANRLEDEPDLTQDSFSHITCRAVTEIGAFVEMVAGFSATGAQLICMKGPKWSEELDAAKTIVESSGFKVGEHVEHVLPQSGAKRTLLFFDKR
ncbi:MAG: 16S rRNA (guanine(527)-N(7))-methyltransferase RsmG [Desulfotalea sp.]|nr:MAG: 16S rRNA (guanine(527)-N(7))-methyltransferase RsmG [Desulfotalea sp.]